MQEGKSFTKINNEQDKWDREKSIITLAVYEVLTLACGKSAVKR